MDFLRLFRTGGFSGSNGPHGFVGDDHLFNFICREGEKGHFSLVFNNLKVLSGFSLLQCFTVAVNRGQSFTKRQFNFPVAVRVGFAMILPALGVTDYSAGRINGFQHISGNFSGIGPTFIFTHILCKNSNFILLIKIFSHHQIQGRGRDPNLTVGGIVFFVFQQLKHELLGLNHIFIHFPVSCNNVLSHNSFI